MTPARPALLSALQLDALTELVNLGIGNAALQLRGMVHQEVTLSVPTVSLMNGADAVVHLSGHEPGHLVSVHQDFEGAISGRAVLLFPQASSMELVRALVGSELGIDEMLELQEGAFAEIGNILLHACLGTIANSLERTLQTSLPEVAHCNGDARLVLGIADTCDGVLLIHIRFAVQQGLLSGYIAMLLDLPSLMTLPELLDAFILRSAGVSA